MAKKTWKEKLNSKKQPEVKLLTFNFAGLKEGSKMLVSSPLEIDEYIKQIPKGNFINIDKMKSDLAKKHKADGVCPVTTAIFLRIVAESAIEDLNAGMTKNKVTPFWRIIEPGSKIAEKLEFGSQVITDLRQEEDLK
jgi:hypothetical protein